MEGVLAHGGAGGMAAALLRTAADTCPRQLLHSAAASLRALLASPAHGAGVRHAVVQHADALCSSTHAFHCQCTHRNTSDFSFSVTGEISSCANGSGVTDGRLSAEDCHAFLLSQDHL